LARPAGLVRTEGDRFEPANEARMVFPKVGNKAEVKAAEAAAWLGAGDVAVVAVPEFVSPANIGRLIRPGDHVFLCVDNHPTRKLVSGPPPRWPCSAAATRGWTRHASAAPTATSRRTCARAAAT